MGWAARAALKHAGLECPEGSDPVAMCHQHFKDQFAIINLSAAFESIADSDTEAAQELALSFKRAIDDCYLREGINEA